MPVNADDPGLGQERGQDNDEVRARCPSYQLPVSWPDKEPDSGEPSAQDQNRHDDQDRHDRDPEVGVCTGPADTGDVRYPARPSMSEQAWREAVREADVIPRP